MNIEFWRGRRVFLTGHTGFKGSWLSLWLQELGAELTGYSLAPPTNPSLFQVARVGEGMDSITADVRDLDRLRAEMAKAAPDIVIHMAAQSLVRSSYRDPVQTYSVNLMGTVHTLEAVRHTSSVKAVVVVTSDKCYENREWAGSHQENDRLGGADPYSSSKACAELVTSAYRSSFFHAGAEVACQVAVASARAGNVIGGGDWARDRLVPDLVRAVESRSRINVRNPQAIRPWQHVLDPLRGYLMLAERLFQEGSRWTGAWNFGPQAQDHQPVSAIVQGFADRWDHNGRWTADKRMHPHEADYLLLDCTKAFAELGWSPRWRLDRALDAVVSWHRAHLSQQDMQELSSKQIKAYMDEKA